MIFDEFKQCNSEYVISEKDSESAISSDGEFNDANKINVFEEDDSYINHIEQTRTNVIRNNIYKGYGFVEYPKKQQPEVKCYSQDVVINGE